MHTKYLLIRIPHNAISNIKWRSSISSPAEAAIFKNVQYFSKSSHERILVSLQKNCSFQKTESFIKESKTEYFFHSEERLMDDKGSGAIVKYWKMGARGNGSRNISVTSPSIVYTPP